jgi:hypothetical protein
MGSSRLDSGLSACRVLDLSKTDVQTPLKKNQGSDAHRCPRTTSLQSHQRVQLAECIGQPSNPLRIMAGLGKVAYLDIAHGSISRWNVVHLILQKWILRRESGHRLIARLGVLIRTGKLSGRTLRVSPSAFHRTNDPRSAQTELDECIGLLSPVEKSHASLAQFRTETKYASLWGERGCRILT